MKAKNLILVLLVAMLLVVTACTPANNSGATSSSTSTSVASQASSAPAAQEPPKNFNETGFPIVNDKITLTALQWTLGNQTIDYPNLWYYKEMEAKTNVHIEFDAVKQDDWDVKQNLMFASNEYTDLILGQGPGEMKPSEEYGVTQKILIPLDDLIANYMPNYSERLKLNDSGKSIPASDGQMYWIGFLIAQGVNHEGTHYINKNWLDKLGLEIPQTIDELTNVLREFKTKDPNGNGKADEIPFQSFMKNMTCGIETHFASFGVPENRRHVYINDQDKVVFVGDQPGFRAALEWLNLCYSEGFLDKEALTMDSNLWGTKMNEDIAGYTTYLRLINTALTEPIASQFTAILPPVADGYKAAVPQILEVPRFAAAITVTNKYPEASARWMDANMETEPMMISQNGPMEPIPGNSMFEKPTMKINDAGKYEIIYVPENNGLYSIVPVTTGFFFAPADYYTGIYEMPPHRVERYNDSNTYRDAGVLEYKSYETLTKIIKPSSEEATRISDLYVEIDKFMLEFISTSISGGVTDASYSEFLKNARNIGIDEYLELYQKSYDVLLGK